MEFKEIKEKMTRGEWKFSQIGNTESYRITDLSDNSPAPARAIGEGNAHAIVTAVNNTYAKGIDPEAISELLRAVKWALDMFFTDPPLTRYEGGLERLEQALAKAEGK